MGTHKARWCNGVAQPAGAQSLYLEGKKIGKNGMSPGSSRPQRVILIFTKNSKSFQINQWYYPRCKNLDILILNSLLNSLQKGGRNFFLMMHYNTKTPLDYNDSQHWSKTFNTFNHKEFSDEFREKSEDFGLCFCFGDTLLKLEFCFIIIQPCSW